MIISLQHNIKLDLHAANFGQVFPSFGQLKFGDSSPNRQVGDKVNVKPRNILTITNRF